MQLLVEKLLEFGHATVHLRHRVQTIEAMADGRGYTITVKDMEKGISRKENFNVVVIGTIDTIAISISISISISIGITFSYAA